MLGFVFGDYALATAADREAGCALCGTGHLARDHTQPLGGRTREVSTKVLTAAKILGLLSIVVAGLVVAPARPRCRGK
jgi:hypothetical protein